MTARRSSARNSAAASARRSVRLGHRSTASRGASRSSVGRDRQSGVAVQGGRIYIERINAPFVFDLKQTADGARLLHNSGTFVKFTQVGAETEEQATSPGLSRRPALL